MPPRNDTLIEWFDGVWWLKQLNKTIMAGVNTIIISKESDDVLDDVRKNWGKRNMKNSDAIELGLQKLKIYMDNDKSIKGK